MVSEQLPVTPKVITWARERAGMTLEEAARKFARIGEWEAGRTAPTYPQLESLAGTFKLPVAAFFFPGPPKIPPIEETFRTLPATEFDRIPRPVRFLLQKAKAFQLNLGELTGGRNPAPRLITHDLKFAGDIAADAMAANVREYIGVTPTVQFGWADDDTALKNWRKALQDVGVFVFKDAFRADGFFGFSLYDEEFPLIYVNNSSAKTRQIFTLFHELAHVIFRTSGIDLLNDEFIDGLEEHKRYVEVMCNRFAGQFLVPDVLFDEEIGDRPYTAATVESLASRFCVSREVIFRKFLDRHWIERSVYEEAAKRWSEQRQGGSSGGDYYRTQMNYLDYEYMRLAFTEYARNRIDETKLAEYLSIKPKNLAKIEEYFVGIRP